ncbi:MAG: PaaI family thioesterase [Verrucomicrobia bacterium]|nr:PaaI family thioesterase [Verrucomicrobiota bacterium]MBV8483020.1 PaaI family thioesterase [Verrucomicrobiota bacterium]
MEKPTGAKIGLLPPAIMREKTGLQILEAMQDGHLPLPPMAAVIPMRIAEVAFGRVFLACEAAEQFYNATGIVHGGYHLAVLDSCMGLAIYSTLGPGLGQTSIETKVNFVRPVTVATGPLRAIGTSLHTGSRTATAEGKIVDAGGKLYAHGTTTCLLFPVPAEDR